MALLKYGTAITPLVNEHYGFTFKPGRCGEIVMRSQPESRTRLIRQRKRMQHSAQTFRAWQGLSSGEQTSWNTFAAAYPQSCKNPLSGDLTGYQNFLKRQFYQYLNYSPENEIISTPSLTEIFVDPFSYTVERDNNQLIFNYEFTNWLEDNIVSLFCSFPVSAGREYQKTQTRYVGYIINERPIEINFGRLYNQFTVLDSRNFANTGWHVPTYTELQSFITALGGSGVAGGKLKEMGFTHWQSPNTGATDEYGFNGRGSGRRNDNGGFTNINRWSDYWSTTVQSGGINMLLVYNTDNTYLGQYGQEGGMNVFLIKDDSTYVETYTGNDGTVYPVADVEGFICTALPSIETKYRNGDSIPEVTDSGVWSGLTSGAWCYYNNTQSNAYGPAALPLQLNISELYEYNFGIIPATDKNVLFKAVPMAVDNGQFFDIIKSNEVIL